MQKRRDAAKVPNLVRKLHTTLDSSVTELVDLEARCINLAADATASFGGRSSLYEQLRRSTDMVYSVMTRVLAAADEQEDPDALEDVKNANIANARNEYELAAKQIDALIQRQARFVYFQGVLAGTAIVIGMAALIGFFSAIYWSPTINTAALVAAMIFGALGSLTSVFQRMSRGQLRLDFTAARWQSRLLGGFRPLIGAIFGTVVQFALAAGLLGTTSGTVPSQSFAVFALIGFASGFSERFATDMIERAGQVIASSTDSSPTSESADPKRAAT